MHTSANPYILFKMYKNISQDIGGILLGVIEILGRAYISSQLSDAIVFAVLIIVLLVKPSGILGKQVHEKV